MECFLTAIFTTWVLCTPFVRSKLAAQAALGPPVQFRPLWCIFCRSDKNSACINKVTEHETDFTQPCTNATFLEFWKDMNVDPPDRPVIALRSGDVGQPHFVCYRMYTVDQSFTFRTCHISTEDTAEEVCHPCTFQSGSQKKRATCCVCSTSNCNIKNSDATRVFKLWIWTLMYFLAGFSLFIPDIL